MCWFYPGGGRVCIPELLGGRTVSRDWSRPVAGKFFNNRDRPVASAVAIIMLLPSDSTDCVVPQTQQKKCGEHG